jgi:pimeloyl-ACP methyl ester carboxylesterase
LAAIAMSRNTLVAATALALLTMLTTSSVFAGERRIEIPLTAAGGLPVAEVIAALAEASGAAVERPAVDLVLPTRGVAGSLSRTVLGECLGPQVRLVFQPATVAIVVAEEELAPGRRDEWKNRLEELSARSKQAANRKGSYGMFALPSYRPNDPSRPTICLVHGLNSSSGGFVHMIAPLEQAGYGLVVFDYPFNQRIDESCAQFRRDWAAFRKAAGEGRPWAILAHSMGALVARSLVEGEDGLGHEVASLIMVAPVNQGAHVARIQPVFQMVSSLFAINSKRTGAALAQLSDGIGQAADDLLPGSVFLRELNGKPRAPGVPYHIVAGNSGVFSREVHEQALAQLGASSRGGGLLSVFTRVAGRELSSLLDELCDDTGDGCVAVDRTRLPGVEDHVTIRANHAELIRAPILFADEGPVACMPYVLRWLDTDLKARAR